MLKGQQGFHGYAAAFASEQGDIVALHIWENADALENSREKIREWVTSNLTGFEEPTSASMARSGLTPSSRRRAAARGSPSTA